MPSIKSRKRVKSDIPIIKFQKPEDKHELNEPVDYTPKVWKKMSNVKKPHIENKDLETDYKKLTKSYVMRFDKINN